MNFVMRECPICEAAGPITLYKRPTFAVMRCQDCDTVFVNPAVLESIPHPVEVTQAEFHKYEQESRTYMEEVFIRQHDFWMEHWTQRVVEIEQYLGGVGRLLDIGCAMGHFQLAAEKRGWSTIGVELSERQVRYATDVLGLDVRSAYFEEVGFSPSEFDAISMWSVIEHVAHPRQFLLKARQYMKPGGILAIQTPNQDSLITLLAGLGYKLSGGRVLLGVYSFDHVFRFDKQTLSNLVCQTGFEVLSVEPYDNLDVMLLRMWVKPHRFIRRIALTIIHVLAGLFGRQNQLILYARAIDSA